MTTYVSASSVSNLAPAPPALVVPVYMYPAEGAWSPLFAAARAHPNLTLMCIINPGNGPGPERLPDASYKSALEQLCALPNVQPLGYVHCTYGKRDVEAIKADIDKYAAWETQSGQAFRLDGVFVDEAPSDPALEPYMATLARHIREAWHRFPSSSTRTTPPALAPERTPQQPSFPNTGRGPHCSKGVVVYNPGTVVSIGYFEEADHVVVFEQSEKQWYDYFLSHGVNQIPLSVRHKCIAMVHSQCLPPTTGLDKLQICYPIANDQAFAANALASQIWRLGLGGLFLTDQLEGGYTRWPATWGAVAAFLSLQ